MNKLAYVLAFLAIYSTNSLGLEYQKKTLQGKDVLLISGPFESGDKNSFPNAIQRAGHIDEVWFDSPGGSVDDGLAIGRKLRSMKLATRIPNGASCDSICAFAFLGGVVRDIDVGGKYGVHMFSGWCSEEQAQLLYDQIRVFFKAYGCNKDSVAHLTKEIVKIAQSEEQQSAVYARKMADFLMEMEVSLRLLVPNFETGQACGNTNKLSRSDLLSFNIINTGS